MNKPLILVTGATGYIASRLIPRLLDSGYRVRCLARDPLRLKGRSWFNQVEVVQADITTSSTLVHVLEGVHTAYYLIHNMSYGHGYTKLESEGARTFAAAAEAAGVEHIIYLGGLADPEQHLAPHMRSRIETGKVLRQGRVPVTEFRAGVITGSGSISFEMIRFLTELCPIVLGPPWMKNRSQPIAIQNVIDYLLAALDNKNGQGQVFEIGGPEITTYKDLMLRYARIRGLRRSLVIIPRIPLWFMAFGVGLMTPVPYPIAYALIGGLSTDSVVKYPEVLNVFPNVKLIDFDAATKDALEKTHPRHIERIWDDGQSTRKSIKHEGCFILHRILAPGRWLGNHNAAHQSQKPQHANLHEDSQTDRIAIEHHRKPFGDQWIEWRHSPEGHSQTLFFSPRGLPGFLYWYVLYPFRWLRFHGLIGSITRKSKSG